MLGRFAVVCFSLVVFLAGCSGASRFDSELKATVSVQRAEFNQLAIEVTVADPGRADLALVQTQGYEQAKDRLLQMDVLRRLGRGQLAEVFGAQSPNAEAKDRLLYGLGMPQAVQRKADHFRDNLPEEHQLLEAFAAGVNRRIHELSTQDADTLKLYRQITRDSSYVPRDWEPADSLAIAQSIAFYLSSRLQAKLSLGVLSMTSDDPDRQWTLPDTLKLTDYLDMRTIVPNFILDADRSQNPWVAKLAEIQRGGGLKRKKAEGGFKLPKLSCVSGGYPVPECNQEVTVGSNSFVAGRQYTKNGDVILGNDPHLMLSMPMTFYEAAYDSTPAGGTFKVRGFNLPGIPLVLIGHNQHLGWGLTNLAADVDDIYLETLRGKNHDQVRRMKNGKVRTIQIASQKFPLKVRLPSGQLITKEDLVVRSVEGHGPIFSDHEPGLSKVLGPAEKLFGFKLAGSYKWTGHEATTEFSAVVHLARAKTYAESVAALKSFGAGAQNVVIGTTTGDIGYYAHGNFPVRKYLNDKQPPFVPVVTIDGEEKEWEKNWREEIPQLYNPESGRIITANNDPFGHSAAPRMSEWEDYFSVWFNPGVRALRIQNILDGLKGKLDLQNASLAQYDHKDLLLQAYFEMVRGLVTDKKITLNEEQTEFANRLLKWDCVMQSDKEEPAMAQAWLDELTNAYMRKFIAVDTVDAARYAQKQTTLMVRTVYHKLADFLAGDGEDHDAALKIVESAFINATESVSKISPTARNWGSIHRFEIANALEGIMPSMSSFPFPRQGSAFTVDLSHGSVGPGFRMLLRIPKSGPIEAVAAVPGGNYASSDARNVYRELVPWLKGQYRPLVGFIHP